VPVEFFIGKDIHDQNAVYAVVDRVHGENLFKQDFNSPEHAERAGKLDTLFESLITYLNDKSKTDDYFLTDIYKDSQYAYGTTANDNEPKIYLVDAELLFYKGKSEIYRHLYNLTNMISLYEDTQAITCQKAREAIGVFLDEESWTGFESPQAEQRARDYTEKILKRLTEKF
jgi:hypothetical protein